MALAAGSPTSCVGGGGQGGVGLLVQAAHGQTD